MSRPEPRDMDIICDNCSTPLPPWSKYCNSCGTPVPGAGDPLGGSGGQPADLKGLLQAATADEYEILKELGRGGMGTVFLARETELDRLVALKVLPPNLTFDSSLVERFKREAQMAAKLRHPNIIPVYRVHETEQLAFFSMHYVPGRTLAQVMKETPLLPLEETERIILETADALAYAHKHGVIHRDVKPANIILDDDGQVHVTDFGIARAAVGNTQLTETGALIGTPQYMAPEQCQGRPVDGRADQYSLGVLAYQVLAGHTPFEADSMRELFYHHMFTPPTPLDTIRSDLPVSLMDSVHKALSKDPMDRFDTLEDFRAAVEGKGPPIYVRWLDEDSELPVPPGPPVKKKFLPFDAPVRAENSERSQLPAVPGRHVEGETSDVVRPTYRRSLAVVAVATLILTVGGVFAVTQGDGPLSSNAGVGPALPSSTDFAGPPESASERADGASDPGVTTMAAEPGRLQIVGELPEGTWVEVDGTVRQLNGGALQLSAGYRSLLFNAKGYEPWRTGVEIEPGGTMTISPALEPEAASPVSAPARSTPRETRPSVPSSLTAELQTWLEQGRALADVGQYLDAAETYRKVISRVDDERSRYRNGSVLDDYRQTAESLLAKARKACNIELELGSQVRCP